MPVEWSACARADMRELRAYIAQDSPHYVRFLLERLMSDFEWIIPTYLADNSPKIVPR